jgi:hypothetical protein
MTISKVISLARRAKTIFESSETTEKRAFLNYLIQNPVVNEKKLYFAIASPFNLVLELAINPVGLPVLDKFRTFNWSKIKSDLLLNKVLETF